jgi:acyl-coenzyme A synthetase/AMP-(fatty) acid ligase
MAFEFVIAVLAAARIGVIIVPMSTRQRAPETEFILTQCEAAGLIYQGDLAEHLPARDALPHLRECFVVGDGTGHVFRATHGALRGAACRHRRGRCLFAALYVRHHRPPEGRDAHPSRHHPLADAL